jgi:hypothetical protein
VRDALAWDRVMLRDDLRLYIRQAWHVVEPSTVYLENWHIDLIAEYLEAVTAVTDVSALRVHGLCGHSAREVEFSFDHHSDHQVDAYRWE